MILFSAAFFVPLGRTSWSDCPFALRMSHNDISLVTRHHTPISHLRVFLYSLHSDVDMITGQSKDLHSPDNWLWLDIIDSSIASQVLKWWGRTSEDSLLPSIHPRRQAKMNERNLLTTTSIPQYFDSRAIHITSFHEHHVFRWAGSPSDSNFWLAKQTKTQRNERFRGTWSSTSLKDSKTSTCHLPAFQNHVRGRYYPPAHHKLKI